MAYVTREPHIFGAIHPQPGELRLLLTVELNNNPYGTIFLTNTSDGFDVVRLAIKPAIEEDDGLHPSNYLVYDLILDPNFTLQLPQVGMDYGDRMYGYSLHGNVSFNMTGDVVRMVY